MGCGPSGEGKISQNGTNGKLNEPPQLPSVDPRLPLTARQKFSLEKSWKAVQRNMDQVGTDTFLLLFRTDPTAQDLFPTFKGKSEEQLKEMFSFETQATAMVSIFDEIVEKLGNMDAVETLLQRTGERHRQYGISATDFRRIEKPLTTTIKYCLGDRYTEKIEEIYGIFITLVFDHICQAIDGA